MPSTRRRTPPPRLLLQLALLIISAAWFAAGYAKAQTPVAPTAPTSASQSAPATTPPPAPPTPRPPRVLIFLDPAHGGIDTGARLGGNVLEKDITLAISFRLRSLLSARGFIVITTREADAGTPPTPDQRAEIANHANSLACLLVHATASGNGIHIFNSSLAPAATRRNAFLPWDAAQAPFIDRSIRLAAEMHSAFDRARIPVTLGRTYLRPLDNLTCPAVAVEIAPLAAAGGEDAMEVSNPAYQQRAAEAIAWALMEWRTHSADNGNSGRGPNPESRQSGGTQ